MIPKSGWLFDALLMATKTSPLGVTTMCRAAAALPPLVKSATTMAQKPAGSVRPPLLESHCRRDSAGVLLLFVISEHEASRRAVAGTSMCDRDPSFDNEAIVMSACGEQP